MGNTQIKQIILTVQLSSATNKFPLCTLCSQEQNQKQETIIELVAL